MSAKTDLYLEEILVSVPYKDVFLCCSISVYFLHPRTSHWM